MKLDLYPNKGVCLVFLLNLLFVAFATAQDCSTLTATFSTTESRCIATGTVSVAASGGSGNYNYKAVGPVTTSFTSSNIISGLPAGNYNITVKDVNTGCIFNVSNVTVAGSYSDPRFNLVQTDVTCINGNDGTVTVSNLANGRSPFVFTIVAPSASNLGLSNTTGSFTNLVSGDYSIELKDSCGGIQTRRVSVLNYNWSIDQTTVTKVLCDEADIAITLKDNKGNTNLSGSFFTGFQYGVVRSAGDTVWSATRTFRVNKAKLRSFGLVAKDPCGNYRYAGWVETNRPVVAGTVQTVDQGCNQFNAKITGQNFLTNPVYCLYTSDNVFITCNPIGEFDGLAYGSYRISIRDECYDTTINKTFTATRPVPSVNTNVTLLNYTCSTFTAKVNGQQNIASAVYRLYNSAMTLIATNTIGTFDNIPFGSYTITTEDDCTHDILTRDFTAVPLIPVMGTISTSGFGCTTFNINMTPGSNLNNPNYCLYSGGVQIACNETGNFAGLDYGYYCVRMITACHDTLERCIGASAPVPAVVTAPAISNQTCSTFTAAVSGTNLYNPQVCIYDVDSVLIRCENDGMFTGLAYGSYIIKVVNNIGCYDTTIYRPFTVARPVPVAGSLTLDTKTCSDFRVRISAGNNLVSPKYYVFNSLGDEVANNTNGTFTLPYGSYTMNVITSCYDTIVRSFSAQPAPSDISINSTSSCNIGLTDLRVTFASGIAPYTVQVYNPWGTLVSTVSGAASPVAVNGLPALPGGFQYTVIGADNCSGKDTVTITPVVSWLNKSILGTSKCPSGLWQNGSGDINITANSSFGAVTPKIIKKNGVVATTNYSTAVGGLYTFSNMEPATYIIEYTVPTCSNKQYDTFQLQPYAFPNLVQSAAYQCDNNDFSVGASVTGGVAPFTYEVIGSSPASPSIISGAQANPVFSVSNGVIYSLVRLRSVDACGNATLNDVSILPLANTIITATSNCYYLPVALAVDTIPNATYQWFKMNGTNDSTLMGTGTSYNIPELMPSDTGVYVSKISVNSGCLTKLSYFHIDGYCNGIILANKVSLTGRDVMGSMQLTWVANNEGATKEYLVERSVTKDGDYKQIGKVWAKKQGSNMYIFTDNQTPSGTAFYRVRIVGSSDKYSFTNTVSFKGATVTGISVFPNPVQRIMNVSVKNKDYQNIKLSLVNAAGQVVYESTHQNVLNTTLEYRRPASAKPGVYVLKINNLKTGEITSSMVMFE